MKEFGKGKLHSGSKRGPIVKKRDQALAIAFSEEREKLRKNMKPKKITSKREKMCCPRTGKGKCRCRPNKC